MQRLTLNYPSLDESIKSLKYIGPLFYSRFKDENIYTLKDLKETTQQQSKAQNTRLLRKILENPRKLQCVGNPRYNEQNNRYEKYCVRRDNQPAWYSVINYLIRKGVSPRKLPSINIPRGRTELCKRPTCKTISPTELLPKRYKRIPYFPIEYATLAILRQNKTMTANQIWNLARKQIKKRKIISTLSANSGNKGKQLFVKKRNDPESDKPRYNLKKNVRRRMQNRTDEEILDLLRKL